MQRTPTSFWILVGIWIGGLALAAPGLADDAYTLVAAMLSSQRAERVAAAEALAEIGDLSVVPALVDAVFFTPQSSRQEILDLLTVLTGEKTRDYYEWVEWVGSQSEIAPAPGYLEWKMSLLSRIDPQYRTVFYAGAPSRIRLEEIIWGGVPLAGIPALDDPPVVAGADAGYLRKKEAVFGLVLNGEARAYPLRILSWHELLNDSLGGEPITLSFCTLCGSGIFYRTRTPSGGTYRFDTSGLLYRSNKLMVDRQSRTLWSNLTGEPVFGRLAQISDGLEPVPGTLTTWRQWLRDNPRTTVLDLQRIEALMRPRFTFDYRPGAADRSRRGVAFPVWLKSDALERDRQVFVLRLQDGAKAYPIDRLLEVGVVNDQIGSESVVLIGDRTSGAVRAYRRGSLEFVAGEAGLLEDEEGRQWATEETGLKCLEPDAFADVLERVPGHVALWFGWYGFFPETEIWLGEG